jgi:DNA-binding CsgD family transcriptional regulator
MILVGRAAELAKAQALLGRLGTGRAGGLLITGPPGIGKTRLLTEIRAMANGRGYRTAYTTCLPLTTVLPFDPVLDLLRGLHHGAPPPSGPGDAAELFPHVLRTIEAAAGQDVIVFFVDDLQWSDRASLELMQYCVARLADLPVGWVVAARTDRALRPVLHGLTRLDWFGQAPLTGLSRSELGELVAAARPGTEGLPDALYTRTAGNPFFCVQLLNALQAGVPLPTAGVAGLLPATVGDAVSERLATTGELPRLAAQWAAAAPEPVTAGLLAGAAGQDAASLDGALDQLAEAGFLTAADDGWRFQHTIVREAIYRTILPSERTRMHGAIADVLPRGADRAPQLAAAGRFSEAAAAYLELAETALARGHGADASDLFARARELSPPGTETAWRARAGEVLALVRAARLREAAELGEPLFTELRYMASPGLRCRLLNRYALALVDASELTAARQVADQLAEAIPDPGERTAAEVTLTRAFVLAMAGDPAAALPLAEEALLRAHAAGDPVLVLRARNRLGLIAGMARGTDAGRELLVPAAAEAEVRELPAEAGLAWLNLSYFADLDGDAAAMERAAAHGLAIPGIAPVTEVLLRGNLGVACMLLGDLDGALAHMLTAFRAAAPLGPHTQERVVVPLAHVHVRRGELPAARRLLDQLQPVPGTFEHRRTLEAWALLNEEDGDLGAAAAEYAEAACDMYPGAPWCLAGQARIAAASRDYATTAACLARLETMTGRWAAASWLADQTRGWLAEGTGDTRAAIESFTRASAAGDSFEAARCQVQAARLAQDGQAAITAARRLEGMGAHRAADRARALARSLGARPGRAHQHHGPLTAREFEIALLVAAGQTNSDIAAGLFLSPRTVERHIGSILTKLGFRSRVQIAAHVATGSLPGTPEFAVT